MTRASNPFAIREHTEGPLMSIGDLVFLGALCLATSFGFLVLPGNHQASTQPMVKQANVTIVTEHAALKRASALHDSTE